jgi:hypothetical protein
LAQRAYRPGQRPWLHARPAKILAQLAKGFDGEIRVRIVDSPECRVGKKPEQTAEPWRPAWQVLEFVAEPTIAAMRCLRCWRPSKKAWAKPSSRCRP